MDQVFDFDSQKNSPSAYILIKISAIKMTPSNKECTECGACNQVCPMDVDVMSFIKQGKKARDTECILCDECRLICPTGAIK